MLFPTKRIAEQCRSFIQHRSQLVKAPVSGRLVHLCICPEDKKNLNYREKLSSNSIVSNCADLHIVLFPGDAFSIAKEFWQHTGMGISSRLAERCLSLLPLDAAQTKPPSPVASRFSGKGHNRHYSVNSTACKSPTPTKSQFAVAALPIDNLSDDHSVYLEERYGRNLPLSAAASAKRALRRRMAGVLIQDNATEAQDEVVAGKENLMVGPSSRGITDVSEDDVYLFQTGMAAIWNAHNYVAAIRPPAKSICFG